MACSVVVQKPALLLQQGLRPRHQQNPEASASEAYQQLQLVLLLPQALAQVVAVLSSVGAVVEVELHSSRPTFLVNQRRRPRKATKALQSRPASSEILLRNRLLPPGHLPQASLVNPNSSLAEVPPKTPRPPAECSQVINKVLDQPQDYLEALKETFSALKTKAVKDSLRPVG